MLTTLRRTVGINWCFIGLLASVLTAPSVVRGETVAVVMDWMGDGLGNLLDGPFDAEFDAAGNLIVTSVRSDSVFRMSPGGQVTEILRSVVGPGTLPLNGPSGLGVDADGNAFVADSDRDVLYKITPGGAVTIMMDATGDGAGHAFDCAPDVNGVCDAVVDAAGNVYVAGFASNNVFRVTPGGAITQVLDASGDGLNALNGPAGLAVDPAGNLYVLGVNSKVFKRTPAGVVTQILDATGDGSTPFNASFGGDLAVDAGGTVYAPSGQGVNGGGAIFRIMPGGSVDVVMDGSGDGMGHVLTLPLAITVDLDGVMYVADYSDVLFRRLPNGHVTALVDGAFGGPDANTIWSFGGVAVSPDGDPYLLGFQSDNVVRVYVCPPEPSTDCRHSTVSGKGLLVVKDAENPNGDKLAWKWLLGEDTSIADFGDPLATTDFRLCAYDRSGPSPLPVVEVAAPPGGTCGGVPCWTATSSGFKYRDRQKTNVNRLILKEGLDGKAKIVARAVGPRLGPPSLPLALPFVVQLRSSDGECWEAEFGASGLVANAPTRFVGRPGLP